MSKQAIKWQSWGTFEGVSEWAMFDGDECIGTITRERPTRWHANGVGGLVRDREAAWVWAGEVNGTFLDIPDGSTLRAAKAIAAAAV